MDQLLKKNRTLLVQITHTSRVALVSGISGFGDSVSGSLPGSALQSCALALFVGRLSLEGAKVAARGSTLPACQFGKERKFSFPNDPSKSLGLQSS